MQLRDAEAAAGLRFLVDGSPTVRIDGVDIEPGADPRDQFVLACRVNRTAPGSQAARSYSHVK